MSKKNPIYWVSSKEAAKCASVAQRTIYIWHANDKIRAKLESPDGRRGRPRRVFCLEDILAYKAKTSGDPVSAEESTLPFVLTSETARQRNPRVRNVIAAKTTNKKVPNPVVEKKLEDKQIDRQAELRKIAARLKLLMGGCEECKFDFINNKIFIVEKVPSESVCDF